MRQRFLRLDRQLHQLALRSVPPLLTVGSTAVWLLASIHPFDQIIGDGGNRVVYLAAPGVLGFAWWWQRWPAWVAASWSVPYAALSAAIGGLLPVPVSLVFQAPLWLAWALMLLSPRAEYEWTARVLRLRPYGAISIDERGYAEALEGLLREALARASQWERGTSTTDEIMSDLDHLTDQAQARQPPTTRWNAPRVALVAAISALRRTFGTSGAPDDKLKSRADFDRAVASCDDARTIAWRESLRP
jgi:hypothetical protein